jgi:DNA-directed RNA polymerase subunit M/transcription elongation factor TFIIS
MVIMMNNTSDHPVITLYKCPECHAYMIMKVHNKDDSDSHVCQGCGYELGCATCCESSPSALVIDKDTGEVVCLSCVYKVAKYEPVITEEIDEISGTDLIK